MKNCVGVWLFAAVMAVSNAGAGVGNVDYSTGQLSFSENIYTVKGHAASLPVRLNYNSNLKKEDLISWVGQGFDLDVPYIERTLVGPPDDMAF